MKRFLKPTNIAPTASGQPHGLAHGGVFKRLAIGGQVGADPSGNVPAGFEAQVELAFDNLLAVIEAAQLAVGDLTRLTAYVVAPQGFAQYIWSVSAKSARRRRFRPMSKSPDWAIPAGSFRSRAKPFGRPIVDRSAQRSGCGATKR